VDLSSIIGTGLGWGALLVAMLLDGMSPTAFFNMSALVLVIGGTAGATIASFLLPQALTASSVLRQTLRPVPDAARSIDHIVELATLARKKGLLELDRTMGDVSDPFVRRALSLVIDGAEADVVRRRLEEEFDLIEERHRIGERIFTTAAGFAPTLGIIGTVVGLIHMLRDLSDPGKIGPAIATAFLATLYGVSLANLLLLPIANKLRAQHEQEFLAKRTIMEGALGISAQENPSVLRERLLVYLPPQVRRIRTEAAAPPQPRPGAAAVDETLEGRT
jgi:chemotaxis protein MotA